MDTPIKTRDCDSTRRKARLLVLLSALALAVIVFAAVLYPELPLGSQPRRALLAERLLSSDKLPVQARRDYEKEIEKGTLAIHNDPDQPVHYMVRARAYAAKGDYPQAVADVRIVFEKGGLPLPEIRPGGPVLKNQAAEQCMSRQDYEGAIAHFDQAIAFFEDGVLYLRRGKAHQALGRYADAYHDFSKAILMEPHIFEHWLARGQLLHSMKLYEDALPDLDRAIETNDAIALAYRHRAEVHEQLGKLTESRADRAKAKELNADLEEEVAALADLEKQGIRFQVSLSNQVNGRIAVFSTSEQASTRNLKLLKKIKDIRGVHLGLVQVGDLPLVALTDLPELEYLYLRYTGISDAGLVHLQALTKMRVLSLAFNYQITDAGLRHLAKMADLKILVLSNTGITDASIDTLAAIKSLEALQIDSTKISPAGVERLKKLLPGAKIISH